MKQSRPAIFRGRHFEPEIISTCVRWYLRFSLSLRNVEEMMAERGLMVDHTTVWRWCQKYGPMIYHRLRGKLKYKTTTWTWTKPTFESLVAGCICSVRWTATARPWTFIYRKRGM